MSVKLFLGSIIVIVALYTAPVIADYGLLALLPSFFGEMSKMNWQGRSRTKRSSKSTACGGGRSSKTKYAWRGTTWATTSSTEGGGRHKVVPQARPQSSMRHGGHGHQ